MNEENRIDALQQSPAIAVQGETSNQEIEYAAITERFVALAIDYGVIFLPLELIAWLICKAVGQHLSLGVLVGMLVGMNLIFILYETIFSSGGRVTLGKNLVGIAVVKKDLSGPISVGQAFLRAVGYYVSALLFFGGFALALVDDRKRTLHDIFGGSVVVELRHRAWWETWALRGFGAVLLVCFLAACYQSVGGRNWKDKSKVFRAQRFMQKMAILEEGHLLRYGYYTNDLLRLALLSGDPVQFQRDMHEVLATGKGNFRIGVEGDKYAISARAKDKKQTPVYVTNKP